jgi:predicted LPLAT superfamily acyltransferase
VAAGFFAFYPPGLANSVRFYRVLFPDKNLLGLLCCVWKQYRNFTTIFLDRFLLEHFGQIRYATSGLKNIKTASKEKTGGVILMSHMGNWEMAAHIMKKENPDIPLLLYMGVKQKEQMEKIQKESLADSGVKVIGVEKDSLSSFELIEGIDFVKKGGMISITGDRLWRDDQRKVTVSFLSRRIDLPKVPYIFALLSKTPIFVFFAFRSRDGSYVFSSSEPIYVFATSRANREESVKAAARRYASMLEGAVRKHPYQWYHFGPFFDQKRESQKHEK